MKHILSVIVENQPGVLARVVGLISGRGYNIDSLNVAPTQDASTSRITIVVPGDDHVLEQVTKQLNKLVDVIKVHDFTGERFLDRELMLDQGADRAEKPHGNRTCRALQCPGRQRQEQVADRAAGRIERGSNVDNLLELLRPEFWNCRARE